MKQLDKTASHRYKRHSTVYWCLLLGKTCDCGYPRQTHLAYAGASYAHQEKRGHVLLGVLTKLLLLQTIVKGSCRNVRANNVRADSIHCDLLFL